MKVKKIPSIIVVCFTGLIFWPTMSKATLVNSNSLIEDNIEYYIQTDKDTYNLGEDVDFVYKVTNLSDQDWRYYSGDEPLGVSVYEERDGNFELIWCWHWDWITLPYVAERFLPVGESLEVSGFWPQIDIWPSDSEDPVQVQPGTYRLTGIILENPYTLTVHTIDLDIEIVPEPTSLLLLAIGILGIRRSAV